MFSGCAAARPRESPNSARLVGGRCGAVVRRGRARADPAAARAAVVARLARPSDARQSHGRGTMAGHFITIPWNAAPVACRACGETIYFVTDARTRRPHPVSVAVKGGRAPERGQVERNPRTGAELPVVEPSEGRGVSHFENCPDAERFRKLGRAPGCGGRGRRRRRFAAAAPRCAHQAPPVAAATATRRPF